MLRQITLLGNREDHSYRPCMDRAGQALYLEIAGLAWAMVVPTEERPRLGVSNAFWFHLSDAVLGDVMMYRPQVRRKQGSRGGCFLGPSTVPTSSIAD